MNRKLAFLVGVFACAYVALSAQTLPAGVQKGPSLGGITQYDFPNGLQVLLYPDAAEPKITVNVTYLVGSRHDVRSKLENKMKVAILSKKDRHNIVK